METREMICIMCPMGCHLTIKMDGDKFNVSGNSCIRGERFAQEEMVCPMRVLTTSVKTEHGLKSCKTTKPVPKAKLFECMQEIEKLRLKNAKYGEIVIRDILGTGADVVVTSN